ncbi:NAD(+) diphosphatase [Paenibacillus sp. FSL R7-0331]|uniref:NAD(+) diphosphatase n=1 Tax=Paenibacillus sp. FSL R7-0331 TaxID=1536773 RepID=UPI0004F74BAE|nr:NAD(+) diphosphatase [Paenibacillus sp. FSL R7-0331]AIQ55379.1 NUDIX hydrolase [Paenibacillus sp. FSL R7-0331]
MSKPEASIYTRYLPSVTPDPQYTGSAYWLITHSGKLLVTESSEQTALPLLPSLDALDAVPARTLYLGSFAGMPCFAAEVPADTPEPAGMAFRPLRTLYDVLDEDTFHLAGRALQLLAWDETHQFCGKCGTATVLSGTEHARSCPACGQLFYPRLAPAVITAILKDGRILLAHAPHFPNNMYGLIAGFVEPGETLEDCVAREIREEVGITVKNITYFGSQQWPFPNSLMMGFLAEYESGEIRVDGIELDHAAWFSPDSLPNIPPRVSIARKIIDWYVQQHS